MPSNGSISLKLLVLEFEVNDPESVVDYFKLTEPMTKEKWENLRCYEGSVYTRTFTIKKSDTEINVKAKLRDEGIISSQLKAYRKSRLFFTTGFSKPVTELAKYGSNSDKTLEELGAKDNARLIVFVWPEERPFIDYSQMACMYGCPMASEVKNAVAAEGYKPETDSKCGEIPV